MEDLSLEVEFLINSPAVKAAAEQVKNDIRGINQTAETEAAKVAKQFNKPIFSDSAKEVSAYKKSLEGLGGTKVAPSGQAELIKLLNQDLKSGIITAQQYEAELLRLNALKNTGSATGFGKSNAADQLGVIERLKIKLGQLSQAQEKTTDVSKLAIYNAKIESIGAEIKRLTNAGKVGFDDMGNALSRSLDRPIGKLERLKVAAKLYQNAAATATNPDLINKYNRKLQETQLEIGRVGNVGKEGFDKMGNAIKGSTNLAGKAFGALRVAAQVLPGIGIAGILAFAVEPIMNYLASLNLFSKKITELVKMRKMMAEVELKGAQNAQAEVTTLKLLYGQYTNTNLSLKQRKSAYEQMQALYPDVFGNMKFEKEASDRTKAAYDNLTESIITTARARAAADKITENESRKLDNETKLRESDAERLKIEKQISEVRSQRFKGGGVTGGGIAAGTGDTDTANSAKLDRLERERNKLIKTRNDLNGDSAILTKRNLELEKAITKQVADKNIKLTDTGKGKPKVSVDESQLKAAEALQQRIEDIENEYTRKSQSKDEAEIQAVLDKFKRLSDEVAKFNADKKNVIKVDGSGLDKVRDRAVDDLKYKQDTERLKIELETQRGLYNDYEKYKAELGAEEAAKRFAGELDLSKTYLQILQDEYAKLKTIESPTGGEEERLKLLEQLLKASIRTNKEIQDQAYIDAYRTTESYEQKKLAIIKKYNDLAAALGAGITDGQKAELLEQRNDALKALDETEAQKLSRFYKSMEDMSGVAKQAVQAQIRSIKQLLLNTDLSSEFRARLEAELKEAQAALAAGETAAKAIKINKKKSELLAELDKLVKAGLTNTDTFKKLRQELDQLNAEAEATAADGLRKLMNTLSAAFEITGRFGESLQTVGDALNSDGLRNGGNLLAGIASEAQNVMTAFDPDASDIDKVQAGIQGLLTLVDVIASSAAERKKAVEEYYRSVIQLQNDYNLSLNDQIRLQSELAESVFVKDYVGRISDGIEAAADAQKKLNEAMAELAQGEAVNGQRNAVDWNNVGKAAGAGAAAGAAIGSIVPVIGTVVGAVIGGVAGFVTGLFGGKKKVDTFVPVLQEYPELIQKMEDGTIRFNVELAKSLVANNLVSDATKEILNNIEAWQTKLDEAREQIKGVVSELVGTLGGDLRNALVDAFKQGENAAEAFGDSVNKVLENIVSNLLFSAVFDSAFKSLQAELIKSFDPLMGDGNVIDDFAKFFEGMPELLEKFNAGLIGAKDQAAKEGLDIFGPDKDGSTSRKKNTLQGAIEGITADQANILAGTANGARLAVLEGNNIARVNGQTMQEQLSTLRSQMMVLAKIETNTKVTAEAAESYLPYLKSIAGSVGDSLTVQLRAAGKYNY